MVCSRSQMSSVVLRLHPVEGNSLSPSRISSTIARVPDVIYRVETPRAMSGCAKASLSSAFNAAIFPSVTLFLETGASSDTSNLQHVTHEPGHQQVIKHALKVRGKLEFHSFRRLSHPVPIVRLLLGAVSHSINLACELYARLKLVHEVMFDAQLWNVVLFYSRVQPNSVVALLVMLLSDAPLPRPAKTPRNTRRSSGAHSTRPNPLCIARAVRPLRCTYASADRGT